MPKRDDDRLVAYLDGELDAAEQREIEAWLEADPEAAERKLTGSRNRPGWCGSLSTMFCTSRCRNG